jgi:hypothetical protein
MSESAIVRTPVEIWIYILQLVIKTRLHCYDNESIVYDLELFAFGCKSGKQFIESERNRTNLRLVCRSWNSILQDAGDRLLMVNSTTDHFPSEEIYRSARRIELFHQLTPCSCTKLLCSRTRCLLQRTNSSQDEPNEFLNREYPCLEALLAHHINMRGQKLPRHAPALRLLSWSLFGQDPDTNYSTLHNLTHLILSDIWPITMKTIQGEIFLPQVTMLGLHFMPEYGEYFKSYAIIKAWRFPKLRRLMLRGSCREESWSDIKGLITTCRITIRELGVTMNVSWEDGRYHRDYLDEVLDSLPNLVTFATRWANWTPLPSLSVNTTWSLLLFDIPQSFQDDDTHTLGKTVVKYGTRRVMFDNTWQDIRVTMNNENYDLSVLKHFWSTLNTMEKGAVLVSDINGIPLTAGHGRDFRSWLTSRSEIAPN